MNRIFTLFLILIFCGSLFAQREKSFLLPASQAKALLNQRSRPVMDDVETVTLDGTWEPGARDIKLMESRFPAIRKLKAKCCMEGEQITDLDWPYMQYVGVVIKKRRLIYINAFYEDKLSDWWKTNAHVADDGGSDWGVIYDPKTGEFSNLAVNGIG